MSQLRWGSNRWRDSYDKWKLATPPEYEVASEEERDPCREGECIYWPGCECEWDLPEQRDGDA